MTGALMLADITAGQVWQTAFSGIAVGSKYALVALGFVIIFRATGVINFAQGSFVLLGGYFAFNVTSTWGLSFYLALVASMAAGALVGVLIEATILRRLVGEAPFTVIMITIGILYVLDNLVTAVWGPIGGKSIGDPWTTVRDVPFPGTDGLRIADRDIWAVIFAGLAIGVFFLFFRYTRLGLAMRATALDQEAALAQGISARRVYRLSWGFAGLVGALAGMMLASGSNALNPALGQVALLAFPAIILGGLDSPLGAVVGGLIIGLIQQLTALLQPEYAEWLGDGFQNVAPYIVMIIILLVRPYGLFGTPEVRRV